MTRERDLQRRVAKHIRDRGGYVVNTSGGIHGTNGTPDLVGCYRGKPFAFELKAERRTPTPMQEYQLRLAESAGALVSVIYDVVTVRMLLDDIDRDVVSE